MEKQPIYEIPPDKYSAEAIIRILLEPQDKICSSKPLDVSKSATYVVDTRSLGNIDDVKKDQFGIWRYSGSHPSSYEINTDDDTGEIEVEKCSEAANRSNVVYLRRLHCTHPSNTNFKRLICFLTGIFL